MRRAYAIALVVVAILLLASPAALAQKRSRLLPTAPTLPGLAPAPAPAPPPAAPPSSPPALAPAPALAPSAAGIPAGILALALMGLGAGALFLLSVVAARRARRPKVRAPRKRSFEAGRLLGHGMRVMSEDQALQALQNAPVGTLVSAARVPHGFRVAMRRRRSEPCEATGGFVSGVFESAWARDVVLRHDACAGKARDAVCVYEVHDPRPRPVTRADGQAAAGSTPR